MKPKSIVTNASLSIKGGSKYPAKAASITSILDGKKLHRRITNTTEITWIKVILIDSLSSKNHIYLKSIINN